MDPHHFGYVVDDLATAARQWHAMAGVGPFLVLPHVHFDELTVDGRPTVIDHTTAFAAHGPALIELQVMHSLPDHATRYFRPSGHVGLNHVAYAVDDLGGASAELVGQGLPNAVRATGSGVTVALHDATPTLGFLVELHQNGEFLTSFTELVRQAARDWDGRDLLHVLDQ
jgi:hypothetical protein